MTGTILTITIPGVPPSVNNMYARGHGRQWRTPRVESYLRDVVMLVRNRAAQHKGLRSRWRYLTRTGSRVRVEMTWYRPDQTRRDSSNSIKVLEDGIATALEIDDQHFDWSTFSAYDPSNPRVELSISLEGGPNDPC